MQRTTLSDFACSVARSLDEVGEWWTPLILRDVFLGVSRFDLIQEDLGIPRKVLSERLGRLVENGVLERRPYQEGRTRYAYYMTVKGNDFLTTLIALMNWGDKWLSKDEGPPLVVSHDGCGGQVVAKLVCATCGAGVDHDGVHSTIGPGARNRRGTLVVGRFVDGRPATQ
jgi:DNA-binding HxlR family transcriptional regulator